MWETFSCCFWLFLLLQNKKDVGRSDSLIEFLSYFCCLFTPVIRSFYSQCKRTRARVESGRCLKLVTRPPLSIMVLVALSLSLDGHVKERFSFFPLFYYLFPLLCFALNFGSKMLSLLDGCLLKGKASDASGMLPFSCLYRQKEATLLLFCYHRSYSRLVWL